MAEDRYHHGDLPAALLGAVGALVEEGGPGAVSLRAVARRAGVSHAAPAHHFGDRGGLLAAYAAEGFTAFHERMVAAARAVPAEAPAGDVVAAIGDAYIEFGMAHPGWYSVMFRPELVDTDDEGFEHAGEAAYGVLLAAHRACLPPDASDEDVIALATLSWATVHGFVSLHNDGPAPDDGGSAAVLRPVVIDLLRGALRSHPHWVGDDRPASAVDPAFHDPLVAAV